MAIIWLPHLVVLIGALIAAINVRSTSARYLSGVLQDGGNITRQQLEHSYHEFQIIPNIPSDIPRDIPPDIYEELWPFDTPSSDMSSYAGSLPQKSGGYQGRGFFGIPFDVFMGAEESAPVWETPAVFKPPGWRNPSRPGNIMHRPPKPGRRRPNQSHRVVTIAPRKPNAPNIVIPAVPTFTNVDSPTECGISEPVGIRPRIIGGVEARPGQWRWVVAIIDGKDGKPFCGATLISYRHILTAAHCVDARRSNVIVRLGEHDLKTKAESGSEDFVVTQYRVHPQYKRRTLQNDIAVAKLDRAAKSTAWVMPICPPQTGRDFSGREATVAGWGTIRNDGKETDVLRQAKLQVWGNKQCQTTFKSTKIDSTMLCAASKDFKADSCKGDSGGPLMMQGPGGRWMLIGIVSWGFECARKGFPGVYTRLSEYLDWIRQNAV